ncbi:MAG TPA: TA system VapC family ribonuclease toxin [Thermoanaerobaculia bacterium]|nr:TA system VapC family ribonuclease toxin [Thermoanaerobaculia bacterium]
MIVVDANVLIFAVDHDSPSHPRARRWIEWALSGDEVIGLPWSVLLAFIRIVTREGILRHPLGVDTALACVEAWLERPIVRVVTPTSAHFGLLAALLRDLGTAGNLTSDAHLAALAIEQGAKVCSADRDFLRFPGVELINPLAG